MSLANELQKLKSLRDSGGITQDEYDKSRNRLLEECVRRIETVHDLNPKACVMGQPPAPQRDDGEPRVKFSRVEARPEATRSTTYSGELDYSLVKPPVRRTPESGPGTCAVAVRQVESVAASRMEDVAAVVLETPAVRPAESTVKVIPPPARVDEERPAASWGVGAQRVEVSFSSHGAVLEVKQPARRIEVFEKEEAPAVTVAPPLHAAGATLECLPSSLHSAAEPAEDSSSPQAGESDERLFEECVPRFGTFYDKKPSGRDRWGLPRFKLVRGVVEDIRVSICQESDRYSASIKVDGQRMAIASSSAIRIAAGDRISLGGYEREGELTVLAYRNDTNGSFSDLSSLQKRYRFLFTISLLSLLIGLAALAATAMVFTHKPAWASHFDGWGYIPYVLSGLAAVAVSYLGLALSLVGKWAKEFYHALAPADSSPEPASYNASSLPLALH
jgi:hypothetical protein